jgi:hypothetical protein
MLDTKKERLLVDILYFLAIKEKEKNKKIILDSKYKKWE